MRNTQKGIFDCPILIVEDDFLGRTVLKEIFRKRGFTNVEEAENGKKALEKIETFHPDLVVLDVIMPEMDGIECCKRLRSHPDPHIANVPILFQTSLDGSSDKSSLFAAGATDYLSKPIDHNELAARAIVHLERETMFKNLTRYKKRMADELDIARNSQEVLIPEKNTITEIGEDYDLKVFGHYQACSELGGDFWGFKSLSNEELAVYMVDFAGHGVNAALNVFRLHALMQAAMDTGHIPSAYLSHLNAHLVPLLASGQYATMFYGIINFKNNILSYASAASTEAVLFKKNGQHKILETTGTVLGAVKEATYQMAEVEFAPGDGLLLYSDALTETPDANGNMLPIEGWLKFCEARKQKGATNSAMMEDIVADFTSKYANNLSDDLTLSSYFRNP